MATIVNDQQRKASPVFLIAMLGALNTITPFSIDMYLPAFPQIAIDLHTTVAQVALSVSTYFLGFALGQILYGPLLDRFGRKRPLYAGMLLYVLATLACTRVGSIETLLVMRFIQAVSGCVASVAAMAMVRDFFPVEKSAGIISLMVLILGASPLLAPTAGSLIVGVWGWHGVFILLAAIAFIMLVLVFFFLPEGHAPDKSISLKPAPIIHGFKTILVDPRFYVYVLAGSFSFAGLFVYVADSPAIFMDGFHLSAKLYGGVFALLSVGFIGGSQLNHLLTRRFPNQVILRTTLICQVITSILFLIGSLSGALTLIPVLAFLFVLLMCSGLTYPNAAALALAPFEHNAGTASALLGFIQMSIGGLISACVGLLSFKGTLTISTIMAFAATIGLIILLTGKSRLSRTGG